MTEVGLEALVAGANSGRLVSFPTDTVPALAVKPQQAEHIFTLKQRSHNKPLILMAATPSELWSFVKGSQLEMQAWEQVAALYWPGALTLVLPASDQVPPSINPQDRATVGLRIPALEIAQQILAQTGPLATTSANLSGQPPLRTMAEIAAQFPEVLTLSPKLAAGASGTGVPSTVVKWTGSNWEILRQGAVSLELSNQDGLE